MRDRTREIQEELNKRKIAEQKRKRQQYTQMAMSPAKDYLFGKGKDFLVDKFTRTPDVAGKIIPEATHSAISNNAGNSLLTQNSIMDNAGAGKTIGLNNIANTGPSSISSGVGGSAGGSIGGQVGSWGAGKLSDAIGVDGVGKNIMQGAGGIAGSIGGNMAGTALANALTGATGTAVTGAATGTAGATAGGLSSLLAGSAAGGPVGLAVGAALMLGKLGFDKLMEGKKKKKQNMATAKAYNEQAVDEMEGYGDKLKEQSSRSAQILNDTLGANAQNTVNSVQPQIPTDLTGYQNYLRDNGYSEDIVAGVAQGLNSGDRNISNWINSYNQSNPDASINIPQTAGEIELARQGNFNVQEDPGILSKVGDIMNQIKSGYNENRGSSFALENLAPDENKTGWNRIGEAFGTGARIVSNPYVQGAVAGTLHGIDKGDALYGLNQGWNYAQGKSKSDKYYRAITGRDDAPIMAGYDLDDYKAHIANKNANREYNRKMYNDTVNQDVVNKKYAETVRHNKAMEAIATERNKNVGKKNGMLTPYQRAQIINMIGQNEDKDTIDALNMLLLDDDVENFSI